MEQSALIPRIQAHRYTGKLFISSLDLAVTLGRKHHNILVSIRDFLVKNPSLAPDFSGAKYLDRGKKYDCFNITQKGVEHLILSFTGSKPSQFKIALVEAFDQARERVENCTDARTGAIEMSRVLQETRTQQGKSTEAHHYINEHNLVYGVVFGAPVKKLVEQGRFSDKCPVIEQMTPREVREISELRNLETQLLSAELPFHERKEQLLDFHQHFMGGQAALEEQQQPTALPPPN